MSQPKDKKLYNYIVNTLGITKELVMEYVNARVESILSKHLESKLEDANYIQNLILNKITELHEKGVTSSSVWWEKRSFEGYVKKCIRDTITQKINEECSLELKMIKKTDQVITKVEKNE